MGRESSGEAPSREPGQTGHLAASRRWLVAHPLLTVFLFAIVVRWVMVAALAASTDSVVIPDEAQYLHISELRADGRLTPQVWDGYGRTLYRTTAAYNLPVTALFEVFGPSRWLAMAWSGVLGAAVATIAAWLGMCLSGRRAALMVGAMVAVLPSQVLWSSVALRESTVWFGLAGVAATVASLSRVRTSLIPVVMIAAAASLAVVCWSRTQSGVAATFALVLSCLFVARKRLVAVALAVLIGMAVPATTDAGPMGYALLQERLPGLGTARTQLSLNADSAFVERKPVDPEKGTNPDAGVAPSGSTGTTTVPTRGGSVVVNSVTGDTYTADNSLTANLRALPVGMAASLLRPFPWERTRGLPLLLARLENFAWYPLYLLGVAGVWRLRRRLELVAFPLFVIGGLVMVGALTQGNLGTAFRHRGQILWALAPLSAAGLQGFASWVGKRRAQTEVDGVESADVDDGRDTEHDALGPTAIAVRSSRGSGRS